jgi:8-oxo-dGTP pyrophosphatase MutT (NUDIX family)
MNAQPIRAAFVIPRSPEGRTLLLRRAGTEDHGGEWALPGGKLRDGETAEQAVVRETLEETGFRMGHAGHWRCRRVRDGVDATTFLFNADEFVPRLNREHDAWQWIEPQEALSLGGVDG